MLTLTIRPAYRKYDIEASVLRAAEYSLQAEQKPGEVSILITGDKEIHSYNLEYRQKDSPTDVLSFENGEVNPESGNMYWGDLIISYQTAARQAKAEGHSVADELSLLAVHGLLHLLGYDHQDNRSRKKMWARQAAILADMGIQMEAFPNLEELA